MSTQTTATMRRADDGSGVLRVSSRFATSVDDLWNAITDPARLARWICTVEGDLRVGGTIRSVYTSGWEGDSVIERCDPPHTLVISSVEADGSVARLTAVVEADGDGALLTVEDTGLSLGALPTHTAGWVVHLEDLAALLGDGGQDPRSWQERWQATVPQFEGTPIS